MHHGAKTDERAATDVMYWGMCTVTICFKNRTITGDKQGTSKQTKRKQTK